MRVVVTGGCGYIGSHVVRALDRAGYELKLYDDLSTGHRYLGAGFDIVEGSLLDRAKLRGALEWSDAVVHLAASAYVEESVRNPGKYFTNNVETGLLLLNQMVLACRKLIVFSSSCAVYGQATQMPISESSLVAPISPYGTSKAFMEDALAAFWQAHGIAYVSLRFFNAAGAHQEIDIGEDHIPETHLVPLLLRAAMSPNDPFVIYGQYSDSADGTAIRDLTHVCDIAEAHVAALKYLTMGGKPTAINIGSGRGISILQLIHEIKRSLDIDVPYVIGRPRIGDPSCLYADVLKAKTLLRWEPKCCLTEIVVSAWRWERKKMTRAAAR